MTTERRCPKCHQVIPDRPEGPIATRLHIQHCGRWLFTVAGKSGLWCSSRDHDEPDVDAVDAILEDACRGRSRYLRLYRLNALSAQMAAVFAEPRGPITEGV
jgi:hypothetical protein